MMAWIKELYIKVEKVISRQEGGRTPPKPVVAERFMNELLRKNPEALDDSLRPFLEKVLSL
jgi:hypothetical protein